MADYRYGEDTQRSRYDRRDGERRRRRERERPPESWRSDEGRMFRWDRERAGDPGARDWARERNRRRESERFDNYDSQRDFPINETSGLIASNKVEGTPVYDRRGDRLGTIYNFMVDKRSGKVAYAVMAFGGFLGMGQNYYPIPWDMLTYDTDEDGYVVDIDERDLDRAPRYRRGQEPRYDPDYDRQVLGYWGLPF